MSAADQVSVAALASADPNQLMVGVHRVFVIGGWCLADRKAIGKDKQPARGFESGLQDVGSRQIAATRLVRSHGCYAVIAAALPNLSPSKLCLSYSRAG